MNTQFKFKPKKIKYLSNVDTLDSSHKKITENINKRRNDLPNKTRRLNNLKEELNFLDNRCNEYANYIENRTKIIDEINSLEEELSQINNYEEEMEYYAKTYQILFNYYDMLDGQIESEINAKLDELENPRDDIPFSSSPNFNNHLDGLMESSANVSKLDDKPHNVLSDNITNNMEFQTETNDDMDTMSVNSFGTYTSYNTENTLMTTSSIVTRTTATTRTDNCINNFTDNVWNLDGTQIFNTIKSSKLDALNELSKLKRKEKKTTRKRVKNVELLVKEGNYNIFDFLHSNVVEDNKNEASIGGPTDANTNNNNGTGIENDKNKQNTENNSDDNNLTNTNGLNLNGTACKNISILRNKSIDYDVFDRAILYDDYKTSLGGYATKKKKTKICINCSIDKVLIYSEGIYACLNCGEVENCIIENDSSNYKDPMVDKPTFPYKRKNHFCELNLMILLVKVISKINGYFKINHIH